MLTPYLISIPYFRYQQIAEFHTEPRNLESIGNANYHQDRIREHRLVMGLTIEIAFVISGWQLFGNKRLDI
jgi:hypothetical protein